MREDKIKPALGVAGHSYIFKPLSAFICAALCCTPFAVVRAQQGVAAANPQQDIEQSAPSSEEAEINSNFAQPENIDGSLDSISEAASETEKTASQINQPVPKKVIIPRGTVVKTFLDEEMSSKTTRPGDEFSVTVAEDIMVGDEIAIPAGSKGFGVVMFANGRGAFGRAGLLDIKVDVIEVGEYDVPVRGRFRQQGKGNSGAMVAAWAAAGVFSGFITGKSGVMAQGQELKTRILSDIEMPMFSLSTAKPFAPEHIPDQEPLINPANDENIEGQSAEPENIAPENGSPETDGNNKDVMPEGQSTEKSAVDISDTTSP